MKTQALVVMFVLGAASAAVAAAPSPGPTGMAPIDCSTANTTLMSMMTAKSDMPAPSSSATLDQNFMTGMSAMVSHAAQMTKLEATCGKDPKTRALAQKMSDDLQGYLMRLQTRTQEGGA